jgi:hypothetical protein
VTPLERLLVEHACAQLVVAYTHRVDGGRADEAADLFVEDGIFEAPAAELRLEGREAIREMFTQAQAGGAVGRHVCTNVAVVPTEVGRAEGRSYVAVYQEQGDGAPAVTSGPVMLADYVDTFVETADGWRISHRRCDLKFIGGSAGSREGTA